MKWRLKQVPENDPIRTLHQQLTTSSPPPSAISHILYQRGIETLDEAKAFFAPERGNLHEPFLMKGMDLAVARLMKAWDQRETILLLGDYDVDGTTSVSLALLCLESFGMNPNYYIPDRYTEGYGISYKGIDYAVELGATLMISMDCGIKAVEKLAYARDKGIEVIICDHHTPGTTLPPAIAILDPKQSQCDYPYKELTGCGITLKLMEALYQELLPHFPGSIPTSPLESYIDLVAMSIASDIVPITGENRVLAQMGLQKLRGNPLPGIKALMDQTTAQRDWTISDLVFFLGPRINAAGRLNHASQAVEVLTARTENLSEQADELQKANAQRQAIDQQITDEALEMIQLDHAYSIRNTTVLSHPEWHKGVVGIVASRLIEHHYRPTVLLAQSDGKWVGSARSVQGFDLYESLEACKEHLLQFGGHKYAAGLTLTEEQIPFFKEKFESVVSKRITDEQKVPVLAIDYVLPFSEISEKLIRIVERMAPFGPGNPRPVFVAQRVRIKEYRILKQLHLKLVLEQAGIQFEAIGFNMVHKLPLLENPYLDIAFQPHFNEWNGRKSINLRLKDFKLHGNNLTQT